MLGNKSSYKLSLLGAFRFESADGTKVTITSKRGRALLAILAVAPKAERSRRWIESVLWGTRSPQQAQASLRKEVFNLRRALGDDGQSILGADANAVWLDLDLVAIDALDQGASSDEVFLEGLDLDGEEGFEDWLRERRQEFAQTAGTRSDTPGPPTHSATAAQPLHLAIAVLPFEIEASDEKLEIAAFGIGEELISRLSRLRWLPVIARSSSFSVPAEERSANLAGKRLGARYIIEGKLKPDGAGYRLQIGLSDAQSGLVIWSEAILLERVDDLSSIDTALAGITAALDHKVDQSEQSRAVQDHLQHGDVTQLVWQARWHFSKLTDDGMEEAHRLLDRAQELAPASAEIMVEKAWLTIRDLWLKRGSYEEFRTLRKLAQKARNADPDNARGYMVCGITEFWMHKPERAEQLLCRAIELNPSLVMAHAQLGSSLHHRGECEQAIVTLDTAIRLSPNDQDLFFTEGELAMAHLAIGNLEEAVDHADESLARRAAYWLAHVAKINALVRQEEWDEAAEAYDDLHDAQPAFRDHFIDWLPYSDASSNADLREGLNLVRSRRD